ncbi:hypothetical protein KIN20_020752 [Parelaphostrongylus tenuis]|uniref:Uncharacterized protein n=1 Tax=Parelaphostrongylus tenuis TaxID=148309 RepID=A0AAD5N726_PARTN|nr:hypothetical protein KIN20_020752 [Parelaphostrongylus tenuis]
MHGDNCSETMYVPENLVLIGLCAQIDTVRVTKTLFSLKLKKNWWHVSKKRGTSCITRAFYRKPVLNCGQTKEDQTVDSMD